ncbi:NADH:flavin oxidoreductase / NADH oxidase family protein [Azotobacter beijerinckii]|uniref:NADH:flavin oxidoreductase / NADH oxidase family protein n=1 Tax=Azotobacter beijerinckii TaxID=170623 RepID=A0A1H7AXT7_9GAMM|nr:NADH:flavin oxidoreductase / NADH oxidase family protein [Azotobacter beijerinckii]
MPGYPEGFREAVRARFPGAIVVCGGYTAVRAEALLQTGLADAVAFGRPYIANPDLVQRFAQGAPLAEADQAILLRRWHRRLYRLSGLGWLNSVTCECSPHHAAH